MCLPLFLYKQSLVATFPKRPLLNAMHLNQLFLMHDFAWRKSFNRHFNLFCTLFIHIYKVSRQQQQQQPRGPSQTCCDRLPSISENRFRFLLVDKVFFTPLGQYWISIMVKFLQMQRSFVPELLLSKAAEKHRKEYNSGIIDWHRRLLPRADNANAILLAALLRSSPKYSALWPAANPNSTISLVPVLIEKIMPFAC